MADTSRSHLSENRHPHSSSLARTATAEKIHTDFHKNLLIALNSSIFLKPLHVEVHNESVWYYNRHRLGPKKHGAIITKYNDSNLKFEGYIYDFKRRQEDLEIVAMRVNVSSANTKWLAYKQAEVAMRERDKFKIIVEDALLLTKDSSKKAGIVLDTHYRVTVVSEQFYRKSYLERMHMIHRELCHSIVGMHSDPAYEGSKPYFRSPPSWIRLASTLGTNVCALEIFWFVPGVGDKRTELIITALTPAQWRPDVYKPLISERLGAAHKGMQALQINPSAKPASQRHRLRKLTTAQDMSKSMPTLRTIPDTGGESAIVSRPSTAELNENTVAEGDHQDALDLVADDLHSTSPPDDAHNQPVPSSSSHAHHGRSKMGTRGGLAETLGLDSSVSGVTYDKLGGIYGHFFNDLSDDIRSMVLQRYKDNKELIRAQPEIKEDYLLGASKKKKKDEDSFQPRTNLSKLRKKLQDNANLGDTDKGTASQAEMRDDVLISNRKIELMAIRLQRMRRMHQLYRARRIFWRREYAAIVIQRCLRGSFARQFTKIYSRLQPLAAIRIQRFYRFFVEKRVLITWWYLVRRLTRFALPKIKRFIRNCFLSWIAKRQESAVVIQKYVRRRLVRVKAIKLQALLSVYRDVFPVAAVQIQRIFRGRQGRRRCRQILEAYLQLYVDIPAAIRIQRVFRGRRAKGLLDAMRYEYHCLLRIQFWARAVVRRIWDQQLLVAQRIKHAATTIQRHYRGHYDRFIYRLKYQQYWYVNIYLPAILTVQCRIRQYLAYRLVQDKLRHARAAVIIQRSFRYHVRYERTKRQRKLLVRQRFERNAVVMQMIVRRYLARKKYLQYLLAQRGQQTLAAKVIMRAWRTYKIEQKYEYLLEETRKENEKKLYDNLVQVASEVKRDVKEAYHDLTVTAKSRDRYKERLRAVEEYITQAALRLSNIKKEMGELTMEDYERGWAEALGQEYEYVVHQEQMAREESRVIRYKLRMIQEEVLALQLEIEDSEMELDEMDQRCIEVIERMRLRLIREQEKKAQRNMQRLLYRERSHWRVRSNRTKKMLAARSSYHRLVQEQKDARTVNYATTVSYEKRERRRDYEKEYVEKQLELEARDRTENAKPRTYEVYAQPVQRTFDNAVASSLSILRGFTLDDRAATLQRQYQAEMVPVGYYSVLLLVDL